jgi:hypothetical protein
MHEPVVLPGPPGRVASENRTAVPCGNAVQKLQSSRVATGHSYRIVLSSIRDRLHHTVSN